MAQKLNQQALDQQRRPYRAEAFPLDFDKADQAAAWRSFKGRLRPRLLPFGPQPTIAFEAWGDSSGLTYRLRIPWRDADYITAQLQGHIPGLRLVEDHSYPAHKWMHAMEIGMANGARPLDIDTNLVESTARTIRHQLYHALQDGDRVLMQLLLAPVRPQEPPEYRQAQTSGSPLERMLRDSFTASRFEVAERKKKLEEPNFAGIIRVAASADTDARAKFLVENIGGAIGSTRGTASYFVKNILRTPDEIKQRITNAVTPKRLSVQLSLSEAMALTAWPLGKSFEPGVAVSMSRYLPPVPLIPTTGRVLGISNATGKRRNIAQSYESATRHLYVLGQTGTGKTTLLTGGAVQDMERGCGVFVFDSKFGNESLIHQLAERIPASRINDVIYIDINDDTHPVGFNVFDQGSTAAIVDELSTLIFENMFGDANRTVTAPPMFYHLMHALAEVPGSTFIDLATLIEPADKQSPAGAWRHRVADQVKKPQVREYLKAYLQLSVERQNKESEALRHRIWDFMVRPHVRNMLGQRTSSFNMRDVIEHNKILLVNLSGRGIGGRTAQLLGTLLVKAIWDAAQAVTPDRPNFLYLDEFASFMNWPVDIEDILRMARSAKLGMCLAHQNIAQINPKLRAGVLANTATKVIFRTSAADAGYIAPEFSNYVDRDAFTSLPRFEALAMIGTDTGYAPPVSLMTRPLPAVPKGDTTAQRVRQLSQSRYGRPIADVERDLMNYGSPERPKRSRPKISGED